MVIDGRATPRPGANGQDATLGVVRHDDHEVASSEGPSGGGSPRSTTSPMSSGHSPKRPGTSPPGRRDVTVRVQERPQGRPTSLVAGRVIGCPLAGPRTRPCRRAPASRLSTATSKSLVMPIDSSVSGCTGPTAASRSRSRSSRSITNVGRQPSGFSSSPPSSSGPSPARASTPASAASPGTSSGAKPCLLVSRLAFTCNGAIDYAFLAGRFLL